MLPNIQSSSSPNRSPTSSATSIYTTSSSIYQLNQLTELRDHFGASIAGAHFCLRDDTRSLEPGQFLHNLAWSLVNCSQLRGKDNQANLFSKLLGENGNRLLKIIANKDIIRLETDSILKKCILDPLEIIVSSGDLVCNPRTLYFLIDGLDTSTKRVIF